MLVTIIHRANTESARVLRRVGWLYVAPLLMALTMLLAARGFAVPPLRSNLMAYFDFETTGTAGLTNKVPGGVAYNATRYGGGTFTSGTNPSGPGFAGKTNFNGGDGICNRGTLLAGKALNLADARGDAIVVPVGSAQLGRTFTISVWHALVPGATNNSTRYFVFEGSTNYDVSWGTPTSAAGPLSSYSYTAYVGEKAGFTIAGVSTWQWHHAVHVFESDGTTTKLATYIDGNLRGTASTGTTNMDFAAIHFGRARTGSDDRDWDGMMDEVAIWNRAVTAVEVTQLYELGSSGQPLSSVPEPASTVKMLSVNPYANVNWDTYGQRRGNLHTHTTNSDGTSSVSAVIDAYHNLGYDVLAITDHSGAAKPVAWPWTLYGRDPATLGMVGIPGTELSWSKHVGSLFTTNPWTSSTNIEVAIKGVADHGGLAQLEHPYYSWGSSYALVNPDVHIPMQTAVRTITQGDFSSETWFRTDGTNSYVLMGNYNTVTNGALNLELPAGNRVRVFLQPSGAGAAVDLNLSVSALGIDIRDGEWHHLAAVRMDGQVLVYVDGYLAGQASDTAGSFDLQGAAYYLGRDSRTNSTNMLSGNLDNVRLWTRGLSASEVAALAAGTSPAAGETAVLAEYRFEISGGVPVVVSNLFKGQVDDTAGYAGGPFHATASGAEALDVVADVPAALKTAGTSHYALRFRTKGVPAAAVSYYTGIFTRRPVLIEMEVLNGTCESYYPYDRGLWDGLLAAMMPQRPVWGMATDDMHVFANELGRDWCMFLTTSLDSASVRESLTKGAFYFSTTHLLPVGTVPTAKPPRIERIIHDEGPGRLTIQATSESLPLPESAYTWVANGITVHTGSTLNYRTIEGIMSYVRAEISGPGGLTLSNPFGFITMNAAQDTDHDKLPDWWEAAYFSSPTVAVATALSPNGTGLNNEEQYIAGTNPLDPGSVFELTDLNTGTAETNEFVLSWPSVSGRLYTVEYATGLSGDFTPVDGAQGLAANPPQNECHVFVPASEQGFFRIRVRLAE